MNKKELVVSISEKSGLNKKNSELALEAFIASVTESLSNDEKVAISGFGTFKVRERAERKGRNPQTKEEIIIPAKKAPAFKASKTLKEIVN